MNRNLLLLMVTFSAASMAAQTAPCGRAVILANGISGESRFLPSPPAFVKASVLNALPGLGAEVKNVHDASIEAKHNGNRLFEIADENKALGYKKDHGYAGNFGHFDIQWKAETQSGVEGTVLTVNFKKGFYPGYASKLNGWATTLMDEVACLVKVTSPWDSTANPTGKVNGVTPAARRSIVLPGGTPIKFVLPNFITTKGIKDRKSDSVVLQVEEDVLVDGAVVIRKGALGVGQYLTAESAKHWGRGASLALELKTVTAADGQVLKVIGGSEKKKGKDDYSAASQGVLMLAFTKGDEATLRAGTSYEVETVGQYTIEIGK